MPSPSWEDINVFFELEESGGFATLGTVLPASPIASFEFAGIFDDPYEHGELGQYEMDTTAPTFKCPDESARRVQRGWKMKIYEEMYEIRLVAKEGQGTSLIVLDYENQKHPGSL